MKSRLVFSIILILMLIPCAYTQTRIRYALVIGNEDYRDIEKLANPVNDASDIADKLKTLGYEVDLQTNVTTIEMNRAINNYITRLSSNKNSEGFFWYAGHGVQIDGENYLLPVNVDSTDTVSIQHSSYSVSRLIDSFEKTAKNRVNIVVLDACRNNPFRNQRGGGGVLDPSLEV